jgi:hypothetical protein
MNVSSDGAAITGFAILTVLTWNAGVGATTAVDFAIVVVAATSVASARLTPTFLVGSLMLCAFAAVVTPVTIFTSHLVPAFSCADSAFSTTVAVAVAEADIVAVNCVVPHPRVGSDDDGSVLPNPNVGSTSDTLSFTFRGAVSSNEYKIDDSAHVTGLAIVKALCVSTAFSTADESLMEPAVMSVIPANVAATVRSVASAACVLALVVTPVATFTVH